MKVYLSCSGKLSYEIGKVLRRVFPSILQSVDFFLATEDIKLGDFWGDVINNIIDSCECAIMCLTKDNSVSPWPAFEAGFLKGKSKEIIPLLIDLDQQSIRRGPFATGNYITLSCEGIYYLVCLLNQMSETPLDSEMLKQVFFALWPIMKTDIESTLYNSKTDMSGFIS